MAISMKPSCAGTEPAPGIRSSGGQRNSNQSPEASPISSRLTGSSTKRLSNVPERMLAASVQPDRPLPVIR
jgi:hypothetical protein